MKTLSGTENIGRILNEKSDAKKVFKDLGINIENAELSLVEAAKVAKVPLQVLLNNLSKALGVEVEWPKVKGMEGKGDFESSTGLKQGRPKGIAKVLAVHSGKGGVGKTFVAIALALYLSRNGKKVGLLDLDIDCPNIPKVLGIEAKLLANKNKRIVPLEFENIKIVSMAGIQERDDLAIMWRGPIIAKAIEQMVHDTEWGELDVLIADLPPGTSDSPLTLFNMLRPDGVLIVTTPQGTAQTDAAKSIDMCKALRIPVIGVLENMTGEIFGVANAEKMAEQLEVSYLGDLPLAAEYNKTGFWKLSFSNPLKGLMEGIFKKLFS